MIFSDDYAKSTLQLLDEKTNTNHLDKKELTTAVKSKDKNIIMKAVRKIYTVKAEDLCSDLPTIGELVRLSITVGVPAFFNPFLGIFMYIIDSAIKQKVNQKNVNIYIVNLNRQITATEKKLADETNPTRKRQLEQSKKDLQKALSKLEDYKYDMEAEDKEKSKTVEEFSDESVDIESLLDNFEMSVRVLSESQQEEFLSIFDDTLIQERDLGTKVRLGAHEINKKIDDKNNKVDEFLRKIRDGIRKDVRENQIKQSFPKLSRLIKQAAISGSLLFISPAISALELVVATVIRKKVESKERRRLLTELNNELEIVEEKIKDADSNNDKKKKYQLIRLKQKLLTSRDKVNKYI